MDWHRVGRISFPNALFSRGHETKTGPDVCRVRGWAIALADGFWSQEVLSALHISLFEVLFLFSVRPCMCTLFRHQRDQR